MWEWNRDHRPLRLHPRWVQFLRREGLGRARVICTDYDLWATKVCGPRPLVEALLTDLDIEAIRLPWTSW